MRQAPDWFNGGEPWRVDLGSNDVANAIAVDVSGRPVIAGTTGSRAFVARHARSGVLDGSFGTGGIVRLDLPAAASVRGLVLDSLGRLVVAGTTGSAGFLARLTPAGSMDPSFGENGVALVQGAAAVKVRDVLVDSSNRVVFAGAVGQAGLVGRVTDAGAARPRLLRGRAPRRRAAEPADVVHGGRSSVERRDRRRRRGRRRLRVREAVGRGHPGRDVHRQQRSLDGGPRTSPGHPTDMVVRADDTIAFTGSVPLGSSGSVDAVEGEMAATGISRREVVDISTLEVGRRGATLADGSTIVVGDNEFGVLVAKLDPSGELDPSFGVGGWTSLPSPTALAVVADARAGTRCRGAPGRSDPGVGRRL